MNKFIVSGDIKSKIYNIDEIYKAMQNCITDYDYDCIVNLYTQRNIALLDVEEMVYKHFLKNGVISSNHLLNHGDKDSKIFRLAKYSLKYDRRYLSDIDDIFKYKKYGNQNNVTNDNNVTDNKDNQVIKDNEYYTIESLIRTLEDNTTEYSGPDFFINGEKFAKGFVSYDYNTKYVKNYSKVIVFETNTIWDNVIMPLMFELKVDSYFSGDELIEIKSTPIDKDNTDNTPNTNNTNNIDDFVKFNILVLIHPYRKPSMFDKFIEDNVNKDMLNIVYDGSFGLLSTNPLLTGNIKLCAIENKNGQNLYIDTIKCDNKNLSLYKYRKQHVTTNGNYAKDLNRIFRDVDFSDLTYERDAFALSSAKNSSYSEMYNTMYEFGVTHNNDTLYDENHSVFAPLYLGHNTNNIKLFCVFRSDDLTSSYENLNDLLKKSQCVKLFDLSEKTMIGEYIRNYVNFINNSYSTDEIIFNTQYYLHKDETDSSDYFYDIYGIDINTGSILKKNENIYNFNMILSDTTKDDKDIEQFLTRSFVRNSVLYPRILNFEFMFDDDADDFRPYRYFGLYFNTFPIQKYYGSLKNITSYQNILLKDDKSEDYIEDYKDMFENGKKMVVSINEPVEILNVDNTKIIDSYEDLKDYVEGTLQNCPGEFICDGVINDKLNDLDGYKEFMTLYINEPLNVGDHIEFKCHWSSTISSIVNVHYDILLSDMDKVKENGGVIINPALLDSDRYGNSLNRINELEQGAAGGLTSDLYLWLFSTEDVFMNDMLIIHPNHSSSANGLYNPNNNITTYTNEKATDNVVVSLGNYLINPEYNIVFNELLKQEGTMYIESSSYDDKSEYTKYKSQYELFGYVVNYIKDKGDEETTDDDKYTSSVSVKYNPGTKMETGWTVTEDEAKLYNLKNRDGKLLESVPMKKVYSSYEWKLYSEYILCEHFDIIDTTEYVYPKLTSEYEQQNYIPDYKSGKGFPIGFQQIRSISSDDFDFDEIVQEEFHFFSYNSVYAYNDDEVIDKRTQVERIVKCINSIENFKAVVLGDNALGIFTKYEDVECIHIEQPDPSLQTYEEIDLDSVVDYDFNVSYFVNGYTPPEKYMSNSDENLGMLTLYGPRKYSSAKFIKVTEYSPYYIINKPVLSRDVYTNCICKTNDNEYDIAKTFNIYVTGEKIETIGVCSPYNGNETVIIKSQNDMAIGDMITYFYPIKFMLSYLSYVDMKYFDSLINSQRQDILVDKIDDTNTDELNINASNNLYNTLKDVDVKINNKDDIYLTDNKIFDGTSVLLHKDGIFSIDKNTSKIKYTPCVVEVNNKMNVYTDILTKHMNVNTPVEYINYTNTDALRNVNYFNNYLNMCSDLAKITSHTLDETLNIHDLFNIYVNKYAIPYYLGSMSEDDDNDKNIYEYLYNKEISIHMLLNYIKNVKNVNFTVDDENNIIINEFNSFIRFKVNSSKFIDLNTVRGYKMFMSFDMNTDKNNIVFDCINEYIYFVFGIKSYMSSGVRQDNVYLNTGGMISKHTPHVCTSNVYFGGNINKTSRSRIKTKCVYVNINEMLSKPFICDNSLTNYIYVTNAMTYVKNDESNGISITKLGNNSVLKSINTIQTSAEILFAKIMKILGTNKDILSNNLSWISDNIYQSMSLMKVDNDVIFDELEKVVKRKDTMLMEKREDDITNNYVNVYNIDDVKDILNQDTSLYVIMQDETSNKIYNGSKIEMYIDMTDFSERYLSTSPNLHPLFSNVFEYSSTKYKDNYAPREVQIELESNKNKINDIIHIINNDISKVNYNVIERDMFMTMFNDGFGLVSKNNRIVGTTFKNDYNGTSLKNLFGSCSWTLPKKLTLTIDKGDVIRVTTSGNKTMMYINKKNVLLKYLVNKYKNIINNDDMTTHMLKNIVFNNDVPYSSKVNVTFYKTTNKVSLMDNIISAPVNKQQMLTRQWTRSSQNDDIEIITLNKYSNEQIKIDVTYEY